MIRVVRYKNKFVASLELDWNRYNTKKSDIYFGVFPKNIGKYVNKNIRHLIMPNVNMKYLHKYF